jgi:hypothetical protein
MQDTKNLIKKRDIEYPKKIKEAIAKKDDFSINYWKNKLQEVKSRIEQRNKNKKKNKKQNLKSN